LTNAIYFKANWKHAFPKDSTRDDVFEINATEKVPTAMMHQGRQLKHFAGIGFQWLELPYMGERYPKLLSCACAAVDK